MSRLRLFALAFGSASTVLGCTVDAEIMDVSDRVTVTSGIYGQGICPSDVADEPDAYLEDTRVGAFSEASPDGTATPIAEDTIDDIGFFELALDADSYWICVRTEGSQPWQDCVQAEVSDVIRCDYRGCGERMWTCPSEQP